MYKILVVDDDAELRENIAEVLTEAGYDTDQAASGTDALEKSTVQEYDVILLDLMMPGMNGIETLGYLRQQTPRSRVIMLTAFATVQNAVDAMQKGASNYLTKPFKIEELLATLGKVLEEAKFEKGLEPVEFNQTLSSLGNKIRRDIVRMLQVRKGMRLMEITRELDIEDHTKVVFHLKNLKESGIITQNKQKTYLLTNNGNKVVDCLNIIEKHISESISRS